MEYNFKSLSAVLGCFDKSSNIKGGLLNDECSLTIKEGKKAGSFELWDEYDEYADSPVFSEYYKNIAHVKGTANWTRIEFKNGGEVTITVPPVKRVLMLDTSKYKGKQTEKREFTIREAVKVPGTGIILEKGDKIFYEDNLFTSLRRLDVEEKEINLILDGCEKSTVWNAIEIGQAFRGDFIITFEGYGTVGLYNPLTGIVITVSGTDITITTDDDTFEFDSNSSGVKSAIQRIKKETR